MDLCWSHETKKKHFALPKLTRAGVNGDKDLVKLSCPLVSNRPFMSLYERHQTNQEKIHEPDLFSFVMFLHEVWLTLIGRSNSGFLKRSHIIPTIAMAMQSQLKKLKKFMTEKMSLEKA